MSELPLSYDQVLAAALRLSTDERQRLTAALAHDAAGQDGSDVASDQKQPDPLPLPPSDQRWGGFVVIKSSPAAEEPLIVANGIDGETGEYLFQLDRAGSRRVALATSKRPEEEEHSLIHRSRKGEQEHKLGLVYGYSYQDLRQAGWAVVVAEEEDTRLLDALAPLIRHRSEQQQIDPPDLRFNPKERCGAWFRRVLGPRGAGSPLQPMRGGAKLPVLIYNPQYPQLRPDILPGNCRSWLARYGVGVGPVEPPRGVPFYLLIAGRPGPILQNDTAYIPFSFQYDLDLFWGVGRLCFTTARGEHDYESYRRYAEQVVSFEQSQARGLPPAYGRHVVYFATRHERDPSTEESEAHLVAPLAGLDPHESSPAVAGMYGFEQTVLRREEATKDALGRVLSGKLEGGAPAVLFTASHGQGCRVENRDLSTYQGALTCQGWRRHTPIVDDVLFSAKSFDELGESAKVSGLVAVMFGCYSVGCPQFDTFSYTSGKPPMIAPNALVSQLPQRMLARGALAVLGHVDRAWTYGFSLREEGLFSQPQAFSSLLKRLLDGQRLGYVTDQFNTIQSSHASVLLEFLNNARAFSFNQTYGLDRIEHLWKAYYDMRSYLLLGDPAVQLPFGQPNVIQSS